MNALQVMDRHRKEVIQVSTKKNDFFPFFSPNLYYCCALHTTTNVSINYFQAITVPLIKRKSGNITINHNNKLLVRNNSKRAMKLF